MKSSIWYFEGVDLYHILCPYKYEKHLKDHPLSRYNKHEFIFMPHEVAQDIYLIAEGKVKIGVYDEAGNELILAYLGKGEIMGEMAYLGKGQRREFAQAMQAGTKICKMSAEKAQELSRDYVPFSLELNKKIADRIILLERRLEILFYKDVRRRLLELMKDLTTLYPCPKEPGWVHHGLTQQEIGSLIGASRKTVSLLLNELEKEGTILLALGRFKPLKSDLLDAL
ncbi:MAG: Crp/Fnr family transcriptional regulator [Bacteroidia bacterium]|nr:Crp/Fnr family transcriptional regulator [Bacteroidia bacterium]